MSFWYLATPYALYPDGLQSAFEAACEQTALLTENHIPVYSPIVHNHALCSVSPSLKENRDLDFWLEVDRPFMEVSSGIIVCCLDSWEKSRGIEREIEYFKSSEKPIIFMDPGEMPDFGFLCVECGCDCWEHKEGCKADPNISHVEVSAV